MREILISSAVCLACLMVALVSQLVAPSPGIAAAPPAAAEQAIARSAGATTSLAAPLELDPDDPNPTLFTMAPSSNTASGASDDTDLAQAGASALGGELVAPKERMTPTGLRITDLVVGSGAEALKGKTVVVNYRGTLVNKIGQTVEFDTSYGRAPFSFPLGGGRVIKGWDEGVVGMKVGGRRKLVIPPDLAYGERGAGGVIPPNATLSFEVELLEVQD
ncbi:MAG: FKBP-type peptidyl-prolyl cis-trans isomerase [Synechococcaceae cyanobacterium]|nr:FKBP-type peptidyl-prolyl cis-trans isomerase [Synechococcaceae cyanobacterium]